MPSLRPIFAALVLAIAALDSARADGPRPRAPAIRWVISQRNLELGAWRSRLALGPRGEVFLGGGPGSSEAPGRVYRWSGTDWRPLWTAGTPGSRTFVLAVDPRGEVWVAPYAAQQTDTYRGLTLMHLRSGTARATEMHRIEPGIWPQAMAWAGAGDVWLAGNQGRFLHLSAGGWHPESLATAYPAAQNIHWLGFRSGQGWAVGTHGLVARLSAGGWRPLAVSDEIERQQLDGLDLAPDGRLWIVGSSGLIAHCDTRGPKPGCDQGIWHRWPTGSDRQLMAISMVSGEDGWAVGDSGTILRFDGRAWRPQPSPTFESLDDIAFGPGTDGWIVGGGLSLRPVTDAFPLLQDATADIPDTRGAHQLSALDVDGDGHLEVFALTQVERHLFTGIGEGRFAEWQAIPPPLDSGPPLSHHSAAWADLDSDGRVDLALLADSPAGLWLYRGLGGMRFDRPRFVALEGPSSRRDSVCALDANSDGHPDLYVTRAGQPGPLPAPNLLLLNDGAGRFPEARAAGGGDWIETFALWGDLDGDLDLDAILPVSERGAVLLANAGGQLRDATAGSGLETALAPGIKSQGMLIDFDRDGDLDVILLARSIHAFENLGNLHFQLRTDRFPTVDSNPLGEASMAAFGDLDHDGWPEIALALTTAAGPRLALYSRRADGTYRDVAAAAGVRDLAGSAIQIADLDADGDLDLLASGEARSTLLFNRLDDGRFLKVRLTGSLSDRQALGTSVRVYRAGRLGDPAELIGCQQLGLGLPASGPANPSELHFGLGPPAGGDDRFDVEARFLSGRRVVLRGARPGSTLLLRELPLAFELCVRAWRFGQRSFHLADPRLELPKLALALTLLSLLRGPLSRRCGARCLAPQRSLSLLLLASYLVACGQLVHGEGPIAVSLPVVGLAAASALILVTDRRLTAFREARYLGPYRLYDTLGEGGMGVVIRARHVIEGGTVALKILHPRAGSREEHRQRFLREAQILTRLVHPNIVRVLETGEIGGRAFISMELLTGRTLRSALEQAGPFSPANAVALLTVAAEALAYIHQRGVVHRDLKAENLFVCGGEELPEGLAAWRARLKLMDFGLARRAEEQPLTAHDGLLGTPSYLAPEIFSGGSFTPQSDLYALGVLGYELLAGRPPFEGDLHQTLVARIRRGNPAPLSELRPDVPLPLAGLVAELLAPAPEGRPESAGALLARLELGLDLLREPPHTPEAAGARLPGEVQTPLTPASASWQLLFERARRRHADRQTTAAQVDLAACLTALRDRLAVLSPEERALYVEHHPIHQLLELERALVSTAHPGASERS